MDDQDVTPPKQRMSRTAVLWLSIGAAVAVIIAIILVSVLASPAGTGPLATSTPTATSTASGEPEPDSTSSPAPGETVAPPGTEPSDPPTPGAPVPAPTAPAVPIDEPATPEPGVTVAVSSIEAVDGEAERAGDVAGPAIRFVVTVTNTTAQAVSLATALVNVYYGDDAVPANELAKPGGSPLPQEVAAGGTATGTFIFTIPEDEREKVLITLDYQVGTPVLAFEGSVP